MLSAAFRNAVGTQDLKFLPAIFLIFFCLLFNSCSDQKVTTNSQQLQRAFLTPDVVCGTVQFADGCSPQLDTLISFGIALIHHMTYEDAAHTFSKVIEIDKDCFWGYWGKAMAYIHPLWPDIPDKEVLNDGYVLSQNALSLAKTPKEKLYGAAVAAFYENGINRSEPERLKAFNDGWTRANAELQDDIEAKMFNVLSMLAIASPYDKTYKVQREAGKMAESVLKIIPDHPGGFHYAIHAYDYPPLANNAIRVARNYYKLAPELPHALHMPTHIFTRLGYWQESIDLNARSAEAAIKIPLNGQISGQFFHALDYMTYAYLQQSQYKKAKQVLAMIDTLSGIFEPTPVTCYSLAAIPSRISLEFQNWSEAAKLTLPHTDFPWKKFPQYEALIYFAKGIGAGRSGNIDAAKKSLEKLGELKNTFMDTEANKYWINQIEIQETAVKGWLLFAQGEKQKSVETMIKAAELEDASEKNPVTPGSLLPSREMAGDLLLELNRPAEALKQYELSLKNTPNRFNALYGAGRAAELSGNYDKRNFYYKALLELSKNSDSDRYRINQVNLAIEKSNVKYGSAVAPWMPFLGYKVPGRDPDSC